ncbi:hypothetical protein [Serratia ureilytica]|uniref:hypothetical protein n=1 Tax=Serratia ureilytica TaxID=300181 RepID=UPI00371FCB3D
MSRSRMLTISERNYDRLNTLSLACRAVETLLINQDADLIGTHSPIHLSSLMGVLAKGMDLALEECDSVFVKPARRTRKRKA